MSEKLIVVKEDEPEEMKEVKFVLEIKPLIAIGTMLILKLRNYYHMLSSIEFSSSAYAFSLSKVEREHVFLWNIFSWIIEFFSLYFLVHT